MAEYLYNLLTIHHFLDIAVQLTKVFLLFDEIFSTLRTDLSDRFQHDEYHRNDQQGQLRAQHDHRNKRTDDGNRTAEQLRNTLTDHLTQGIRIVGVAAHDITMSMGIKIFDRQLLHVSEHLITDLLQGSLGHIDHQSCIQVSGQRARIIDHCHNDQSTQKRCKGRVCGCQERRNIIVDQIFNKQVSCHSRKRTDHDSDQYDHKFNFIIFPDVTEQALQSLARVAASAAFHVRLHIRLLAWSCHSTHSVPLLSAVICKCHGRSRWS